MAFPIDTIIQGSEYRSPNPNNPEFPNNQVYSIFFFNYGAGYNDLLLNAKLSFVISDYEITNYQNITVQEDVTARLNTFLAGKIIKHESAYTANTEEIQIVSVTGYDGSYSNIYPDKFVNPFGGRFPDRIFLIVNRGYNGTTPQEDTLFNGASTLYIEPSGSTYDTVVSDTIDFNESNKFDNIISKSISDGLSFSDNSNFNDGPVILIAQEILGFSGYTIPFQTLKMLINDNFLLQENLEISSAKEVLLILNDLFTLRSHSSNKVDYDVLINEVIGFYDRGNVLDHLELFLYAIDFLQFGNTQTQFNLRQIIELLVNDNFELFEGQEQIKFYRTLKERVYDAFNLSNLNNTKLGKDFMIAISDKINFFDFISKVKLDLKLVVEDILNFYMVANIDGIEYECYAMNLDNLALTRFTNYNFNSYCQFNGKYYGITREGIANLIYINENGERVEEFKSGVKTGFVDIANIESGVNNFNSMTLHKKQLKVFYLYLSNSGQVFLRVTPNEGDDSFDYLVKEEYNENIEMAMQDIGKNVKGTRYQFEVTSLSDMQISEMVCIPLIAQSGKKVG